MANVVHNRTGQCEAANDRTDSIRGITKCLHQHVRHTIFIATLHPATCCQVVDSLNTKEEEGRNNRCEGVVSLTEIKDRLKNERRGDDWDNMGYQEVIYEIVGHFLDALGILSSRSTCNRELGRSRDAFIA